MKGLQVTGTPLCRGRTRGDRGIQKTGLEAKSEAEGSVLPPGFEKQDLGLQNPGPQLVTSRNIVFQVAVSPDPSP